MVPPTSAPFSLAIVPLVSADTAAPAFDYVLAFKIHLAWYVADSHVFFTVVVS
jgi:hypothetical protein